MITRIKEFAERFPENPWADVDPVLGPWAEQKGIRIAVGDPRSESEIRLFRAASGNCEVLILPPNGEGNVVIEVQRRYNRGRVEFSGPIDRFRENLDRADDFCLQHRPTGGPSQPTPAWLRRVLTWLRLDKG